MDKKLLVYKGFDKSFFDSLTTSPLVSTSFEDKTTVSRLDDNYKMLLLQTLLSFQGTAFVSYEEFVLLQELGEDTLNLSNARIIVFKNSLYPDYYPLHSANENLAQECLLFHETYSENSTATEEQKQFFRFYGDIKKVENTLFASYKNSELVMQNITRLELPEISINDHLNLQEANDNDIIDTFEINNDVESCLRLILYLKKTPVTEIGISINDEFSFKKHFGKQLKVKSEKVCTFPRVFN